LGDEQAGQRQQRQTGGWKRIGGGWWEERTKKEGRKAGERRVAGSEGGVGFGPRCPGVFNWPVGWWEGALVKNSCLSIFLL
jgi:hypothetical protein